MLSGSSRIVPVAVAIALAPGWTASGREVLDLGCTSAESAPRWEPHEGTAPAKPAAFRTPEGAPALELPCRMAGVRQRAYWDFAAPLDLAGCSEIELWARTEGDPTAIAYATVYFQAGAGWYAANLGGHRGEWSRVVLRRGDFRTEGTPGGWGAVARIRLSFWKGSDGDATVYVGGMRARIADVVVIRNTAAGSEAGDFADVALELLAEAGIRAAAMNDVEVGRGGLEGKKLAIYPHNPKVSHEETEAVEAFVSKGGKLLVCYSLPARLATLLGIRVEGYLAQEYPAQFSSMSRLESAPEGFPELVRQASWNILKVKPERKDCVVVSVWHDAEGRSTGYPSLIVGSSGAYFSHVILGDDRQAKSELLRSVLGRICPPVWSDVLDDAREATEQLAEWQSFGDVREGLLSDARRAGREQVVGDILHRVAGLRDSSTKARGEGRPTEALDLLSRARRDLVEAFALAQPDRDGEFRGVWCHSAYGVRGETWDDSIRRLKESGFNAIVPNMLWGGVADYESDVLPVRDRVSKEGDQIALCLAACRRHGVEIHVWKVNWNLGGAPASFVSELRAQKRLQVSSDGEETPWLCPSHPDNFALERDSMLEVARKYDVDGIHFDYIRYPDRSRCFCPGCRERFEKETERLVSSWPSDVVDGGARYQEYQDFRRERITRLVRAVAEEARRVKAGIRISAAVFSTWPACRDDVAQDWVTWARNGYVDFLCPMNYTSSIDGFRSRLRLQLGAVGGRVPVYSGIGASAPGLVVEQVIDQVRAARALGADGFIVFNYAGKVATDQVPMLGLGIGCGPSLPPHQAPRISWCIRQGGRVVDAAAFAGAPLEIEVAPGKARSPGSPYASWTLEASVETCGGKEIAVVGETKSDAPPLRSSVQLTAGRYRLVARGSATLEDGQKRPFTARGPFVDIQE